VTLGTVNGKSIDGGGPARSRSMSASLSMWRLQGTAALRLAAAIVMATSSYDHGRTRLPPPLGAAQPEERPELWVKTQSGGRIVSTLSTRSRSACERSGKHEKAA
jgi:hypothetical protein